MQGGSWQGEVGAKSKLWLVLVLLTGLDCGGSGVSGDWTCTKWVGVWVGVGGGGGNG